MGAESLDMASIEHQDYRGSHGGRDTLRDNDLRAAQASERSTDMGLGRGVEGGETIVEDKDVWARDYGASYAETLTLTAREISPPLLDTRIETLRERVDKIGE